ncbi:MAG TPA: dihydrolipoyl dehydrogenase [Candidatus Coprenecus merdigallinarum]|nr:dihydrolipoyl dehydrogenase [Candidatus Coprenecus merdigallinarum]
MDRFDIIVVGSGPGGYVAAVRAAQLGKSVAVIERSEIGGICLNWGCIPTKALLKSAQAYTYACHAAEYGFEATDVKADLDKMVARSRGVAAQMSKGVEFLIKKNKITLLRGEAVLKSGHTVEVNDFEAGTRTVYEADHIILAVGSRANSLPFAPIDGERIISYRQALVPDKLPKSLAVIGSGAIGSEFAFFYRSLGVEVYLIEYLDRILPLEDDDVSAQISRSFRKAGIKVMASAQVKSVDTAGELCRLTVETKKGTEYIEAETVLSAVGVIPNTDSIGLEEVGVEMVRGRKIKVDEYYRTNVEGVYAIGDIIPTQALAHVASAEGICCVEAICGLNPKPIDYGNIPGCTYVTPEVASVGMTERAVKEAGIEYRVGKFFFLASGKATAAGEKDGFVKLIIDSATDRILGAHLVGANVTEMISGIVAGRNVGMTASDLIHSVHPHPTMSEAIMEAAEASHGHCVHQ